MSNQPLHFEVPLPRGRRLLIDPTGFDKIKHLSWQAIKHPAQEKYYVQHGSREQREDGSWRPTSLLLARFLTGLEKGDPRVADHINGNPLDNRWVNLRVCSGPQNVCNRKMSKHNTSGFKGVSETKRGRYAAQIAFQRKTYYLGTFDTPEEAHRAYCEAAVRLHGEFANFGVEVPPPGPGVEMLLPSSIGFLRQHLPDPKRHCPVKVDTEGVVRLVPLDVSWSEHRSAYMIGPLGDDKLIYGRVLRRFRDLVLNGVVAEKDLTTAVILLTAAEVRYDRARTVRVSRQKYPAVVQVFKNMHEAGLWREWALGQGVRWGFEYGWTPEEEKDRWRFGAEFALNVGIAKEGVDKALGEWSYALGAVRAAAIESAKQERLARPENQPFLREPSKLRPVRSNREVRGFIPMAKSRLRLFVANHPIFS